MNMETMFYILLMVFISVQGNVPTDFPSANRLGVVDNFSGKKNVLVFLSDNTLKMKYSTSPETWSGWIDMGSPAGLHLISNPATVHGHKNEVHVYVQASDGQVYRVVQTMLQTNVTVPPSFKPWQKVSSESQIPRDTEASLSSKDSVTAGHFRGNIVVFARSLSQNSSHLYWSKENSTGGFTSWGRIGGGKANLHSDAAVVFNGFSGYYEAFAVMNDGKPYRMWQKGGNKWSDWRTHGDSHPAAVKTSMPVALPMSNTFFNNALEVFILGTDGHVHHMFQTTCDHVDNPWGYCTWGVWHTRGNKVPVGNMVNQLTGGSNIHGGNEVFTVDNKGSLWHLWQLKKGGAWSNWRQINSSVFSSSQPRIVKDDKHWWMAFVLNINKQVAIVQQEKSIHTWASRVAYGGNLTVSWSVPIDEATNSDWIGIYPQGTQNDKYLDFRYVQGSQNPKRNPVPNGSVTMNSYLPNGTYDIRYLVNRKFLNVLDIQVEYYNGSSEAEWRQLYKGLAVGLGTKNTNLVECVEDGDLTIQTFKESFIAFENREVHHGLQLFGKALEDVEKTLVKCLETDLAKALEKFITDLIKCTESECLDFIIDLLNLGLIILYEDTYEIFGDIHAASNSFNLVKAYEQGGLCIGRVVQACISLPK